eukprot:TRINITY_DN9749_c0_g1_i1.p1 TRINITY_DN9749_c0_g1~~TRINITY_DN9749_c0_g1_i1.p1  ORF type:complete len:288 (+),score=67.32 TRINITY_DN9749_c0_g1_i1:308-1171(+)
MYHVARCRLVFACCICYAYHTIHAGNMKALRIGALRRCTGRRWDTVVLHYNAEFGTAAVEGGDCEIASVYEKKHRLKGGELGGADGRNALQAGPGVMITATSCVGSGDTALPTTQVVDEDEPAQGSLQFVVVKGATGGVYPIPTTRYKKGHKVIAIGYSEADNTSVVSPGVIDEESANENSFTVSCTPLGPGSFIVDMETPNRVCGVVGSDGTIISAKDPSFIVNWVTHALPALVPAETTRFSPEVMQYINDVKRSIVKNQEYIPTMSTCQRIFVKNSIEDFKYFML